MTLTERIAELDRDLALQQTVVQREVARLRGIEAELASMRSGASMPGDLNSMARSDAIVAVLRDAGGTLSPGEIVSRLVATGRDDELRSVTATLSYLLSRDAVRRPERGRYLAV